jgi:hypothetical protein
MMSMTRVTHRRIIDSHAHSFSGLNTRTCHTRHGQGEKGFSTSSEVRFLPSIPKSNRNSSSTEWRHFLPVIGHALDIGVVIPMFTGVYWLCFRLAEAVSATVTATLICDLGN